MAKGGTKQPAPPQVVPTTAMQDGAHQSQTPLGPSPPRPMRLKILYSLDELMPNCLARAKEVAQVRVVQIDTDTAIGLVDLRTCVLNITYSSPEILHQYGCDYSVYAYDYSEPDTPVVGLGLLSWVLSLPALNGTLPDPDAIAPSQSSRIVTGRVQKNLLGLFAGGIKETLEVRMRLCKVPALKQAEYVNQMNQYSYMSKTMPVGMDIASWWTQSQIHSTGQSNTSDTYRSTSQGPPTGPPGPPSYAQLGGPSNPPSQQQYPMPYPQMPYYSNPPYPPSEGSAYVPATPSEQASASAIVASVQPSLPLPPPSMNTDKDDSQTENIMPPKKKQKVVGPKKGRGRPRKHSEPALPSSEANPPPSLDRTISEPINIGQAPPSRAIPLRNATLPKVQRNHSDPSINNTAPPNHTTVNRVLSIQKPLGQVFLPFVKPKSPSVIPTRPPPLVEEPETSPAATSPMFGASPALLPPATIMNKESPYQSPETVEDNAQENLGEHTDIDSLFIGSSPPVSSHARANSSRFGTHEPSPEGLESPSESTPLEDALRETRDAFKEALSRDLSPDLGVPSPSHEARTPNMTSCGASPAPEDRLPAPRSSLSFPVKPTSESSSHDVPTEDDTETGIEKQDGLHLPRTSKKSYLASENNLPSDTIEGSDVNSVATKKRRFRATEELPGCATTKERIERQMKEKIAAGEMPNFCTHCGQIETPTWRKVKISYVDPDTSEEKEKEILLCNPCGLWHHNHKTMRPQKFWDKPEDGPKPPRKPRRRKAGAIKSDSALPSSEPGTLPKLKQSKPMQPPNSKKEVQNTTDVIPEEPENSASPELLMTEVEGTPDAPDLANRSGSGRAQTPTPASKPDSDWTEAIGRQSRRVQSSPLPNVNGTEEDPISLVTPEKRVNRILFPTIKQEPSTLDDGIKDDKTIDAEDVVDKENLPPSDGPDLQEWEAELEKEMLFACEKEPSQDGDESLKRERIIPSTPSKQRKQIDFMTPIRKTPGIAKSPWRSLSKGTPGRRIISTSGTPISKLLGTSANLMSPASGEIILQLLQNTETSRDSVASIADSLKNNEPIDFGSSMDFPELDMNFDMDTNDYLLSTEKVMPSSPPPAFRLYDDGGMNLVPESSSSLWSDVLPSDPSGTATYSLDFLDNLDGDKANGFGNFNFNAEELDLHLDEDLVVDFSEFLSTDSKTMQAVEEEPGPADFVATKMADVHRDIPNSIEEEASSSEESPSAS